VSSTIEAPPEAQRDGEEAELPEKIAVKFGGTVVLDRSDPRDQAIFRSLELGDDVTLMIEGRCLRQATTQLTDREGELVGVRVDSHVAIHSTYTPVDS
jgi:hypothetical protein